MLTQCTAPLTLYLKKTSSYKKSFVNMTGLLVSTPIKKISLGNHTQ